MLGMGEFSHVALGEPQNTAVTFCRADKCMGGCKEVQRESQMSEPLGTDGRNLTL